MVYGCGNNCVKFFFFLTNLLLCLFGAFVFGFSLWANLDKDFATHLQDFIKSVDPSSDAQIEQLAKYEASLWVLVAVGALLFLVGFLGCCGAACENSVLITLFSFVVALLTILELGATIFALVSKDGFISMLYKVMDESSKTKKLRDNLKPIESLFKCCGATVNSKAIYVEEGHCSATPEAAQQPDCFTVLSNMIQESGELAIIFAFVLCAIQLVGLCFACVLCRAQREGRYASYYA